ncbi:Ras-related protein RABD2a [Oopsacas minuta]|uniref:Ras-related protein RABD2a n=1 Tax=Oopsacas minuta TaxID=111878 RepID=A0AAV7K0Q8_9METZ|nr:Ras-related protein RABD2a [Oopsacas minuta]
MAQTYDTLAKVVLIGESGVGKSSLVHRFLTGNWLESTTPTIGIDFHVRDVECNGKTVKLQIWDTGGQERFYSLTNTYYRDMHGAFLVFDLSSKKSFDRLKEKWYPDLCKYLADQGCSKVIIGNKCDLEQVVPQESIDEFADEHNLRFMRASAQQSENVEQVMIMMVQNLLDKVFPSLHNPDTGEEVHKSIRLNLDERTDLAPEEQKALDENSPSICCPT